LIGGKRLDRLQIEFQVAPLVTRTKRLSPG
jgi:hypothetical protein